jgi:hypothetical protein
VFGFTSSDSYTFKYRSVGPQYRLSLFLGYSRSWTVHLQVCIHSCPRYHCVSPYQSSLLVEDASGQIILDKVLNNLSLMKRQASVLSEAHRALSIASMHGFKMDAALAKTVRERDNATLPWTDSLIGELETALVACRVS